MKNNFIKRALTSAVFVVVLIGGSLWHPASFFILFSVIVFFGLLEFYKIINSNNHKPQIFTGVLFGLSIFTSIFLTAFSIMDSKLMLIHIPLMIMILVVELYRKKDDPFANIAFTIFGSIYVAVPFGLLSFLVIDNETEYNPVMLISYFALIWTNDTGAYIIGSAIGKNKLFERISPKKSWEGFFGGAIFTLLVAFLASKFITEISLTDWLAISIITFTFGTLGDLFESLLKRSAKIKDSGNILPGHGGILDRFDSLLLSAPIVFVYLILFA